MIERMLVGGLMLMAMGCTPVPPPEEGEQIPVRGAGRCDAAPVQQLVGRQSTTEIGTEARSRSGAASIRWIRPGDVVTMDYREDRLNIHLDARGRVARLVCG
jgi:hypothetical protein